MFGFLKHHKPYWAERAFVISVLTSALLFVASIAINVVANDYAILKGKNPVTDIILNNIRVFDVDWVVNFGPLLIIILVLMIFLMRPSAIPFTIKALALFIIIRACFISATHLGQFQPQLILPTTGFMNFIGGGNSGGLFFSGHTGVPFLLGLVFWDNRNLRRGFIILSVVMGTSMLLAHLHYTIDVLGAFFITPSIFRLAQKLFPRDYALLERSLGR